MAWNITSKTGEITALQRQAKDFDEQKRIALCFADRRFSPISDIDSQMRSTFNSYKKSNNKGFLGTIMNTDSTAASSNDSPTVVIMR